MILPNGVGTIDSDYRGELKVLATWIGEGDTFTVGKGERVAQMLFAPVPLVHIEEVDLMPWSQQSEALVDSVHLDNIEERVCNPLMFAFLAS